jgi:hypothetical protein
LGVDLFSQADGWLHLLVSSGGTAPLIVDIIGIVIGHALPIDESAVRWNGCEEEPMTPDAPGPIVTAAIPGTSRPTPSLPAASVMAVSMTAAVKTHGVAGAVIAAIRTMSGCKSRTPESNGNQTHETS